jgi:hypothetical protein
MGYLTGTMTVAGHDKDGSVQLVEVFATASAPEAEVVRGLLESNGIPAEIRGMSQSPYRMGDSYLFVPAELEDQARAVIDEARGDAGASTADGPGFGLEDDPAR